MWAISLENPVRLVKTQNILLSYRSYQEYYTSMQIDRVLIRLCSADKQADLCFVIHI